MSFIHPSLELVPIEGKGQGFRVKEGRFISQGTLLIRERSHIEVIYNKDDEDMATQRLAKRLRRTHPSELDSLCGGECDIDKLNRNQWAGKWKLMCEENQDNCEQHTRHMWSYVEICFQMSKINHSCDPNADKTDPQLIECASCDPEEMPDGLCKEHAIIYGNITAIRDIKSGEEVCVTYLDPNTRHKYSTERRQKYLKRVWGFDCVCNRCTNSEERFSSDDDIPMTSSSSSSSSQ